MLIIKKEKRQRERKREKRECHVILTKKVLPLRKARALIGLPECANPKFARRMK